MKQRTIMIMLLAAVILFSVAVHAAEVQYKADSPVAIVDTASNGKVVDVYRNSIGDVACYKYQDGHWECLHNGVLMEDVTPQDPGIGYKAFDWVLSHIFSCIFL